MAFIASSFGLASDTPPTDAERSIRTAETSDWFFSILPKAFQKQPTLDMTFNTEVTPYGRLLRHASPENPVYYVTHNAGFRQLSWPAASEHSPLPAVIERTLTAALAANGFLAAKPGQPPGLAIIFYWGSHNKPDLNFALHFPEEMRKNFLERARLIGGVKFADYLVGGLHPMRWEAGASDFAQKMDFLADQAAEELYYVIVSAYDYQALARGKRELAWRTTMTVTAAGLAMTETLRPLIVSAAPFLGRETLEPEIGSRRIDRERRAEVEIGPLTVVKDQEPEPVPPEKKDNR